MKLVINRCHGGFGLSLAAIRRLAELKGHSVYFYKANYDNVDYTAKRKDRQKPTYHQTDNDSGLCVHPILEDLGPICTEDEIYAATFFNDFERNDPHVVQVVEELGEAANGQFAELGIVEVPDDLDYVIEEYDGSEWVAEVHRTWT